MTTTAGKPHRPVKTSARRDGAEQELWIGAPIDRAPGRIAGEQYRQIEETVRELSTKNGALLEQLSGCRSTTISMEPPRTLPMDLLLEIIARSDDITTVVRCGVGSKPLRRAMLDPSFHRRLAGRGEEYGGFDPGLLLAVSYRLAARYTYDGQGTATGRVDPIMVQPSRRLHFDTNLLRFFDPASCRDGFLVLIGRQQVGPDLIAFDLLVCNTITGRVAALPSLDLRGTATKRMYQPAWLTVDAAAGSFELLVMYKRNGRLATQTFLSQEQEWGAPRKILAIDHMPPGIRHLWEASPMTAPAVLGRTVHWLCYTEMFQPDLVLVNGDLIIFALHADSVQASVIKLPEDLLARMGGDRSESSEGRLILATTTATAEGARRLSLVVAESLVISTWTLEGSSSIGWSRREVIQRQEIDRTLSNDVDAYQQPIRFSMFGERSGTVLFWMQKVGLVQLNLGTKKALVLSRGTNQRCDNTARAFLCEVDLISVLKRMKYF